MMSFSQEEFDQQLNIHLRKHNIRFGNPKKSISCLNSSSLPPTNKSMPVLNDSSCNTLNGSKSRKTKDSTIVDHSLCEQSFNYDEELKDEVKGFTKYLISSYIVIGEETGLREMSC